LAKVTVPIRKVLLLFLCKFVNKGPFVNAREFPFDRFMALSDSLLARFGRNWGIAKEELQEQISLV
jgi:hypothetical protein